MNRPYPVYQAAPDEAALTCGVGERCGCGRTHPCGTPTLWRVINRLGEHKPVCARHLPPQRVRLGAEAASGVVD